MVTLALVHCQAGAPHLHVTVALLLLLIQPPDVLGDLGLGGGSYSGQASER